MSDAVEAMVRALKNQQGPEPPMEVQSAAQAFVNELKNDPSVLEKAARRLGEVSPHGAGLFAMFLGAFVEQGADASQSGPALISFFRDWLAKLPTWPDDAEDIPEPNAEQKAILEGLMQLCPAVVSHLAPLPDLREQLAQDDEFLHRMEQLEQLNYAIMWVREAVLRSSGSLIALHTPSRQGLQLEYENVSYCFGLFSLMQAAIGTRLPDGKEPVQEVLDIAAGELQAEGQDEAWWHYGDPRVNTPEITAMVWGEGLVRDLPTLKGQKVMLLWPPLLDSRGWSTNFFGPPLMQMPPKVFVTRELESDEVEHWFELLDLNSLEK